MPNGTPAVLYEDGVLVSMADLAKLNYRLSNPRGRPPGGKTYMERRHDFQEWQQANPRKTQPWWDILNLTKPK